MIKKALKIWESIKVVLSPNKKKKLKDGLKGTEAKIKKNQRYEEIIKITEESFIEATKAMNIDRKTIKFDFDCRENKFQAITAYLGYKTIRWSILSFDYEIAYILNELSKKNLINPTMQDVKTATMLCLCQKLAQIIEEQRLYNFMQEQENFYQKLLNYNSLKDCKEETQRFKSLEKANQLRGWKVVNKILRDKAERDRVEIDFLMLKEIENLYSRTYEKPWKDFLIDRFPEFKTCYHDGSIKQMRDIFNKFELA